MIRKHSVTLHGHRTSFSLEEPFFLVLKAMAEARGLSLAELIADIDDTRENRGNLSSALRIAVLEWVRGRQAHRQ